MSAAVQCSSLIEQLYHVQALTLVCLAQAIDLRKIHFKSSESQQLYTRIRKSVPFISRDQALGREINQLTESLKEGIYEKT
jgi:histidine ammonia-lyase